MNMYDVVDGLECLGTTTRSTRSAQPSAEMSAALFHSVRRTVLTSGE